MFGMTNLGEQIALQGLTNVAGTFNDGGILFKQRRLILVTAVPAKDGTGMTEVANGNGYTTSGQTVNPADWTISIVNGVKRATLNVTKTWTASGSGMASILGVVLVETDGAQRPICYWTRPAAVSLLAGDTMDVVGIAVELN